MFIIVPADFHSADPAPTPRAFIPEPFVARRGLSGGHRMTLAGNFLPRSNRLVAPEERLIEVEPGVRVLCHCHWQSQRKPAATVVIVHGLEGSSASQYVIGTANKAFAAGMNVVRMNMRNCGGTENLGPTLYHSGLSADVAAVVAHLARQESLERIALAGYSMGGNLVLKCAGDWGANAPAEVVAVCGVSPALDLGASADALHLRANLIYEQKFLFGLRRRLQRKARLFPERYPTSSVRRWRSLRDFDDRVTAPFSGFRGADDYYTRASSSRVIEKIRVPTLIIHAADDPFLRILPETRAKLRENRWITFVETARGGHCAFLAPPNGYDGRWAERQVVRFIELQIAD